MIVKTDLDLAPIYRTEANYWKSQYFESRAELVKANKGLRRLRRSLQGYKDGKTTHWSTPRGLRKEGDDARLGRV